MATASGDTFGYGDQDFLVRREFVYCNVDLHGGGQRLHPYVLMQVVVERSMFTVRDVPLEIRRLSRGGTAGANTESTRGIGILQGRLAGES